MGQLACSPTEHRCSSPEGVAARAGNLRSCGSSQASCSLGSLCRLSFERLHRRSSRRLQGWRWALLFAFAMAVSTILPIVRGAEDGAEAVAAAEGAFV